VKAGDTLSSIAEKYGLELAQLLALNPQITDPDNIMPGMKIKIAVGPVSIAPGQPEEGHPINPVGQVTETPFMQFPVPAVEAGAGAATGDQAGESGSTSGSVGISNGQTLQSGAGLIGMNGYQQNGWGEMKGTSGMSGTGMRDVTGTVGMDGSGGMPGTGSGTDMGSDLNDTQPYLSTIPQIFAGNPLYSGVGALGDASNTQGNTHYSAMNVPSPQSSVSPFHVNVPGALYSEAVNVPSPLSSLSPASENAWGVAASGADNVSADIHTPYLHSMPGQLYPNMQQYGGVPSVWPEAYTWSTPFEYMAANNANASLSGLPNQLQNYPPDMPANVLPNQLPVKKPCGCGGRSSVGYYSLAEKRRAEEATNAANASNGSEEGLTSAEEARIAALEQSIEALESKAETDQPEGTGQSEAAVGVISSANNKRETNTKRSRSRNRKRTGGQKKSNLKVHLHGMKRAARYNSNASRSKPWLSV